jgi:hypothetical protein
MPKHVKARAAQNEGEERTVREGVRWRHTHSWGTSDDKDFARNPDRGRHPLHRATSGIDDRLHRRTLAIGGPARCWSSNGQRIKAFREYSRGEEKVWV